MGQSHALARLCRKHSSQAFQTGRLCPRLPPWPGAQLGFRGEFRSERKGGRGCCRLKLCFNWMGKTFPASQSHLCPGQGLAGLASVPVAPWRRKHWSASVATSHHTGKSPGRVETIAPFQSAQVTEFRICPEPADLCRGMGRPGSSPVGRRPRNGVILKQVRFKRHTVTLAL